MLLYVLIIISLSLAGVAGLQLMYMFYLDRLDGERKKRLHELESRCKYLSGRIKDAETRIAEQNIIIDALSDKAVPGEEAWADVIDDR